MNRARASSARGMVMILLSVLGLAAGAREALAQPAAACVRPPLACPPPWSTQSSVSINLEPDGSGVCRFVPRQIADLDLVLGDDVIWQFCNACPTDMSIQMDTGIGGPFESFESFEPPPSADNLVAVPIRCNDYATARGRNATKEGSWKYNLRVALKTSPQTFVDEIDPKLEIDDDHSFNEWLAAAGTLVGGLLVGWLLSRRRLG